MDRPRLGRPAPLSARRRRAAGLHLLGALRPAAADARLPAPRAVGWLLLTERPRGGVQRAAARGGPAHSVDICRGRPTAAARLRRRPLGGGAALPRHALRLGEEAAGLAAPAEALLARCGVRLPALAPMADASATVDWLAAARAHARPVVARRVGLIQLLIDSGPSPSSAGQPRRLRRLQRAARALLGRWRGDVRAAEAAAAAAAAAAEAAADRADEVAIAARRCVQGAWCCRTRAAYLINDIDCIRTAHSPMPRRSAASRRPSPSTTTASGASRSSSPSCRW